MHVLPGGQTTPDSTLDEALKLLEQHQIRRLPVVDKSGKCVGMLSQADIARHAPKEEKAELIEEVSQPK